jgi:hypothetical protein
MKTKLNKQDKKNIVLLLQKYDNTMTNDTINEIVTKIKNKLNYKREGEKYRGNENTDVFDDIMLIVCNEDDVDKYTKIVDEMYVLLTTKKDKQYDNEQIKEMLK